LRATGINSTTARLRPINLYYVHVCQIVIDLRHKPQQIKVVMNKIFRHLPSLSINASNFRFPQNKLPYVLAIIERKLKQNYGTWPSNPHVLVDDKVDAVPAGREDVVL
jgi:hypothetical protein